MVYGAAAVIYTFVCGPLKIKETALEIMRVLATRTGGFMVQRGSGRFRQVRARRHARRSRTRITQGRAAFGRLCWLAASLSPTDRPGGPWMATGSILARCAHIRTACRDTQSPNALCAIWIRLAVVLAPRPPSPIVGFIADCSKVSRFDFFQLIYPESASRPRPCCGGAPQGDPHPDAGRAPLSQEYFSVPDNNLGPKKPIGIMMLPQCPSQGHFSTPPWRLIPMISNRARV